MVSGHTHLGAGNTAVSNVCLRRNVKPPFKKKGGGASKSFVGPGFSHCSTGCDFFKHTGGKRLLLMKGETAANPDLEHTSGYTCNQARYEFAIVCQQRRGA